MEVPKIYTAMVKAMGMIEAIGKEKTNTFHRFKYRGIDDVYNCLHPILKECGIFTLPKVLDVKREERASQKDKVNIFTVATIQYTFCTVDGSSVECVVVGEALDSGDKSMNKAMAIAHKYALFQTFCIPTEDMKDPDAEAYEIGRKYFDFVPIIKEIDAVKTVDELQKLYAMHKDLCAEHGTLKEFNNYVSAKKHKLQFVPMTDQQRKAIMVYYGDSTPRDMRIEHMVGFLNRSIGSFKEVSKDEASKFIDTIIQGGKNVE